MIMDFLRTRRKSPPLSEPTVAINNYYYKSEQLKPIIYTSQFYVDELQVKYLCLNNIGLSSLCVK